MSSISSLNTWNSYANLISSESLEMVYDNSTATAYFDLVNRKVILPTFEFLDEETTQLLVSHEVGHALYSKYSPEEFKTYVKKYKSLLNVVEDAYIESQIKKEFPGLKSIFKKGYTNLYKNDFFGEINVDEIKSLTSKLNLDAKLGFLLNIKFDTKEENEFALRMKKLTSNEDVIELCEDIYQYIMKKKEDIEDAEQRDNKSDTNDSSETNDSETNPSDSDLESDSSESSQGSSSNEDSESDDTNENDSDEDDTNEDSKNNKESNGNSDKSNKSDKSYSDSDLEDEFQDNLNKSIKEYGENEVEKNKESSNKSSVFNIDSINLLSPAYTNDLVKISDRYDEILDKFPLNKNLKGEVDRVKKLSKTVNLSFQRKKSAFEEQNSKKRTVGKIDRRKIYSYKTNTNIFQSKVTKPEGQNHCINILIDCSGSMSGVKIKSCVIQGLVLAEFCNTNNIPFQLIGFGLETTHSIVFRRSECDCVLFGSSEKYNLEAIVSLMLNKKCFVDYKLSLGGTPLIEAVLSTVDFFKKNGIIDKKYLYIITDGSYNESPVLFEKKDGEYVKSCINYYCTDELRTMIIDNHLYKLPTYDYDTINASGWMLEILMEHLKKQFSIFSTIITINDKNAILTQRNVQFIKKFIDPEFKDWSYYRYDLSCHFMYKHAILFDDKIKNVPDVSKHEVTKYIPSNKKYFDQYINVDMSFFNNVKLSKKNTSTEVLSSYLKENKVFKQLADLFIDEIA